MKPLVTLNMREALPIIREAFENETLQMFNRESVFSGCLYAGPCAIGVCIPQDKRDKLDKYCDGEGSEIGVLISEKVVSVAKEEQNDFVTLQCTHDLATICSAQDWLASVEAFSTTLTALEQKYLGKSNG